MHLCPWDFLGKNTGEGCQFLFQGIFLTQGSNLYLLHCQVGSLPLSHQRSPYNRLQVSKMCITALDSGGGGFIALFQVTLGQKSYMNQDCAKHFIYVAI